MTRGSSTVLFALLTCACGPAAQGSLAADGAVPSGSAGLAASAAAGARSRDELVLTVGFGSVCARTREDTRCWGWNSRFLSSAQLLLDLDKNVPCGRAGAAECVPTPTSSPRLHAFSAFSLGQKHSCGADPGGSVSCWGGAPFLPIRTDPGSELVLTALPIEGAVKLVSGLQASCALHRDGQVSCWGDASRGLLGGGTTTFCDRSAAERAMLAGGPVHEPCPLQLTKVAGLGAVRDLVMGSGHACALSEDGGVRCWGDNEMGELGVGAQRGQPCGVTAGRTVCHPKPVKVPIGPATSVALGSSHSCAVSGGRVFCWGYNENGRVGVAPDKTDGRCGLADFLSASEIAASLAYTGRKSLPEPRICQLEPVEVAGLREVRAVVATSESSCALHDDGGVSCWGQRLGASRGQLDLIPTRVEGVAGVTSLHGLGSAVCAVTSGPTPIVCWGDNEHGELGPGSQGPSARGVPVAL